jgi:hypothetical protein
MNLRFFLSMTMGALLVLGRPAVAAGNPAVLLDLVGHQGMLTYRLVKSYCQVGNDVRMTVAVEELKSSLAEFDANLSRLKELGVGEGGAKALAELERLWPAVRDLAKAPVARDQAPKLFAAAQALQVPTEALTGLLGDLIPQGRESQFYLANRQRILSQELAALYMLQSWGFDDEAYQKAYRVVVSAFEEGLLLLGTAPNRPALVVDKMKSAVKRWDMMKVSNQDGSSNFMPNMAVRMLDGILLDIEAVAAAYLHEIQVGGGAAPVREEQE